MTQEHIENIFHGTGLNPDSLKATIVCAQNVWHDCKWSTVYDDTSFIHYILPPQVADEPMGLTSQEAARIKDVMEKSKSFSF